MRQLLSFLWSAIFAGVFGYVLYILFRLFGGVPNPSEMPMGILIGFGLIVLGALSSVISLAKPKALIGTAIAIVGLYGGLFLGVSDMVGLSDFAVGMGQLGLFVGLLVIGCLAFAAWDSESRETPENFNIPPPKEY